MNAQRAYFVTSPRTILDLCKPHQLEEETPYKILFSLCLSAIDYENFVTDMTVNRDFLEHTQENPQAPGVLGCILITRRDHPAGVLVVPGADGFVAAAALFLGG